jgi:AcrR family transcriptional regulator
MSPQTTKDHILISTIDAIEKYGLANLTTRLIADEADVNNAALHYYFGTKDQLIDTALNYTANHMLSDTEIILNGDKPIEVRMREMIEYIIEGVLRYPNLIRAHMTNHLLNSQSQVELSYLLESWINLAAKALAPYVSVDNQIQLKLVLNMVFSVILIAGLLKGPPEEYSWIDLRDSKEREALLKYAIDRLLGS